MCSKKNYGAIFKISGYWHDANNGASIFFLDINRNIIGYLTEHIISDDTYISIDDDLLPLAPSGTAFFGVNLKGKNCILYSNYDLRDVTDIAALKEIRTPINYSRMADNLKYFQLHIFKGYYYNKNGIISKYISDNRNYAQGVTPLLRLYPNVDYRISNLYKESAKVAFFDRDGVFLGVNNDVTINENQTNNTDDLIAVAPKGTVYFSVSIKGNNCTLYCDIDLSTYIDIIAINVNNKNPEPTTVVGNILNGKKWYCCGDSYSEGDYNNSPNPSNTKFQDGIYAGKNKVYSRFIALRNNMDLQLLAKCGATCGAWKEDVDADTIESPSNTNTFYYNQYPKITEDSLFDGYITLWFGINDSGHCTLGDIDDEDLSTFYGALNWSAINLITKFPLAHIGFIVSYNCNSTNQQAVREVAQKWGIPYLDTVADIRIPTISGQRNTNSQDIPVDSRLRTLRWDNNFRVASNNNHPNEKAHEYESYFIENWLRSL